MSYFDDGGRAFPNAASYGMALRDYFAANAMQGLIPIGGEDAKKVARAAYILADAMLEAREKSE